jgi:hypothetical protein
MDFRFRGKSGHAADGQICCDAQRGIFYDVVGCDPRTEGST